MLKIVSGFTPIPNHSRSSADYHKLGKMLEDVSPNPAVVYFELRDCWLAEFLRWGDIRPTHSVGDDPKKNTLEYHIVQHQKIACLRTVADQIPQPDVFAWVDYGIAHVPGMTATLITELAVRANDEKSIVAPGCWDKHIVDDRSPCWRFCGGLIIVPRKYLIELDLAMQTETIRLIRECGHVTWEVNTLARVEQARPDLPIWWYKADHDQTMFTNYGSSHAC